jgi:hypothetical protein
MSEYRLACSQKSQGDTSIWGVKHALLDGFLDHTKGVPLVDDVTVLAAQIR